MSLHKWIEMSTELEVDGLEFYSRFLKSYDNKYLSEIRKTVEKQGLEIPMMCYSSDFTLPEREDREDEVRKQKEMIKVTQELGGKFCRVLSGQRRPEINVNDGIKWVVESIQESLITARECDIILVMENHYKDGYWKYPEFAQRKEVFLSIINQIDSPNFGVQYDPSNAIVAGDDPVELLNLMKNRVKTMHASDRYLEKGAILDELRETNGTIGYSPKLHHGVIGKGLNDYEKIFSILRDINFSGWISIEDGMDGIEEIKESADFLKIMRAKYFGGGQK
ncbi:MAG: sugar phosphate isomerase/epimerase family protein [bacterium]